jgi:hypothetical protein
MKKTKLINEIAGVLLIIAFLTAVCSIGTISSDTKSAESGYRGAFSRPESLQGTTEFSFINAGDGKVWHVINKYRPVGSGEGPGYNMSTYDITSDSVNVVNEYAGIPDAIQWDLSLSGLTAENLNFNKTN